MSASDKFQDSKVVVNYLKEKSKDKEIMVPLTSSLYIPGKMADTENVLIEVGASYFIELPCEKAKEYCDRKIKMLTESSKKVAEIVQVKKQQLLKV